MYFKNHFTVKVTYRKKTYELECHVEHMLIGKKEPTWLFFCGEYGRTGTSQCFGALRFKMEGGKRYDMLTTDGMRVTAISPKDVYTEVQTFEVVDADGQEKYLSQMKELCEKLNTLIPIKGDEDRDKINALIAEATTAVPHFNLYWDRDLYINCGYDDKKLRHTTLHSGKVRFEPSEDYDEHPGLVVRYKQVNQTEYEEHQARCHADTRRGLHGRERRRRCAVIQGDQTD